MSHTDPQNDIPCTACEAEGSRSRLDDDGLCPDCRTPAGRLVTALGSLGIKAEASDARTVSVGAAVVDLDDGPWTIMGADADGITAADAIAAIVQAPGQRAEREARVRLLEGEVARLRGALGQARVASRFWEMPDAWDQVRDAISALDEDAR